MLVRRMLESLRRQDWTMVAIEFALVVAGVLMAFQINEWANEKEGQSAREEATARLLEEAEMDVAYLKSAIAYESAIASDLALQLRAVDQPELRREAAEDDQLFNRARGIVPLAPPTTAYEDIVSAGNLTSIGDASVRDAISKFHATLSFEERMRQQLWNSVHSLEDVDAIETWIDPKGDFHFTLDFDRLKSDRQDMRLVVHAAQNHKLATNFRKRALRDAEAMCKSLATAVGRPCNLNLPPPTYK